MNALKFIDILFVTITLAVPIVILVILRMQRKATFVKFMTHAVVGLLITMSVTGWWTDYSMHMQLEELGFDRTALYAEKYADVDPADLETVRRLERSSFGLSWPVKVLIGFVALGIPYLFTVYVVKFCVHCLFAKREEDCGCPEPDADLA